LKTVDADFAAQQVQGLLKSFGFWPQISMGLPPLDADTKKPWPSRHLKCSWHVISSEPAFSAPARRHRLEL
jgi:hypothetical protein